MFRFGGEIEGMVDGCGLTKGCIKEQIYRTNNSPALVKESRAGLCFDEGEMKGISGYRFSSNCYAVMVALPSAAKVMPSADWGV